MEQQPDSWTFHSQLPIVVGLVGLQPTYDWNEPSINRSRVLKTLPGFNWMIFVSWVKVTLGGEINIQTG
ncbi:rCG51516, partial [Rattus norvegicus]